MREFFYLLHIYMSGYHQHAPIATSQFISKPFNRAELLDKVREALESLRADEIRTA